MTTILLSAAAQAQETSDSLSALAKYGPLGIFCVLLIAALVWTVKAWRSSMEARTADAKEYAKGLKEVGDAGAALAVEANKVQEAAKTALDKLTTSSSELRASNSKEHGELSAAVDKLREKQVEFVAEAKALAQAKGKG